ncbi:MAG: hypothetical protein HGA85_08700 [Nanoarchaeota archaeon]|nr:hypothetical protein [Nanoarchaeota archaeon]
MKTKKMIITFAAILVGLIILLSARNMSDQGFSISAPAPRTQDQISPVNSGSGEVQEVTLKADGYTYVMSPQPLKLGVPVRMTVDLSTVNGCLRSIVIPAFGVSKNVYQGDNIVEFTPTQAGTFNIRCSMNMGKGTFTVADSTGAVSGLVEAATEPAATTPGRSCGMANAGACGCGGNGGDCGCGGGI